MFSKSCEYAIRAVIFICTKKEENKVVKIQEIAEAVGAPVYYTSKILQQLSRLKIMGSLKGQNGGFYMGQEHKEIRLIDIVNAIDGDKIFNGCALGLSSCSETKPCPLHAQFKSIRKEIKDMLESTTIHELSKNLLKGKTTLKKLSWKD
ncbi:MAG: RrF2 family transcriptional regulator [Bacteroidia bacterium]